MRVLLDTNVIIDIYTNRPSGDAMSRKLLMMEKFGDAEFWGSASSFTDMFFILNRFFKSECVQEVFEESLRWLHICTVNGADIEGAAKLKWPDFEDCIIDIAAQKVKADYLLTRNARDFTHSACTVLTPTEFFDVMESEYGLAYDEAMM